MRVRDLMDRSAAACSLTTTLDDAILAMRRLDRDVLPVMSPDGRVTLGIVSDRDIALALALHPRPARELTVAQALRQRGVMVAPDDDVHDLIACMVHHRASRVAVADANGWLEGTAGVEELLRRAPVSRLNGGELNAKDVLEALRVLLVPVRDPAGRSIGSEPEIAPRRDGDGHVVGVPVLPVIEDALQVPATLA